MKQKRKVKSLLPHENKGNKSLLSTFLIVLGIFLCLGSVSLWTMSSVYGVGLSNNSIYYVSYDSSVDDNDEAVYRVEFVDSGTLDDIANKMFMMKNSLYITPNPVIVNPVGSDGEIIRVNKVGEDKYGHVLGGSGNTVNSENVTLIAGENNNVSGNDNATILGGISNKFGKVADGGTPLVVLGGENNVVGNNHSGVALIGGSGNRIGTGVSNAFILGGEGNTIGSGSKNVIIGGKEITISENAEDIFAYSNTGKFEPKTNNAFYLNVGKGVGFGIGNSDEGLSVSGAISFGEINIEEKNCNDENLGVIGSYSGCLIGCTKAGINTQKWELLDRSDECKEWLNTEDKILTSDEQIEEKSIPDTDAFCADMDPEYSGNMHLCTIGNLEKYRNVVFESILIDSDDECLTGENKCVYKCNEGYHLLNGDNSVKKCLADCVLPWDPEGTGIKHGEIVTGYNVRDVACSNYGYKFPSNSSYIGAKKLSVKDEGAYESCTNYNHQKQLVCKDGTLYLANSNGKATNNEAEKYGFVYDKCNLHNFQCLTDSKHYNLSKTRIINTGRDNIFEGGNDDRKQYSGERATYELCLDWRLKNDSNSECEPEQSGENKEEHYKLVKCKTDYSTGDAHPFVCMRKCKQKLLNGTEIVINHDDEVKLWLSGSETCTGVCKYDIFQCDDGNWKIGLSGGNIDNYGYDSCTLNDKKCDGYNVNQQTYDEYKNVSLYDKCELWNASYDNLSCTYNENKYKLIGCVSGYHANILKTYCEPNLYEGSCKYKKPEHSKWLRSSITKYPWMDEFPNFGGGIWEGKYVKRRDCEWDGNESSCWKDEEDEHNDKNWGNYQYWNIPVDPSNTCEWECDENYVKNDNGDGCRELNYSCGNNINECSDTYVEASESKTETEDEVTTYTWMCGENQCHYCEPGTSWDDTNKKCVKNLDASCGSEHYECFYNDGIEGVATNRHEYDTRYVWDCLGKGEGEGIQGCFECKEGYKQVGNDCLVEENSVEIQCGSADGKYYAAGRVPEGNSFCVTPAEPSTTSPQRSGDDKIYWDCKIGENSKQCSANVVDCGSANGQAFKQKPQNGLCNTKSILNTNHAGFSDRPRAIGTTGFEWRCVGGDVEVKCDATKADCSNTLNVDPDGGKVKFDGNDIKETQERTKECGGKIILEGGTKEKTEDRSCEIKFYGSGGNPTEQSKSLKITDITRYAFDGWESNGTCGSINGSEYTFPDSNGVTCTEKAKWKFESKQTTTGSIKLPGATRNGYNFIGWSEKDSQDKYTQNSDYSKCSDLYAHWASCQGSFQHAHQVKGIGSATTNVTSKLYDTETEANSYNCSWVCDSEYKINAEGTDCEEISYSCLPGHWGCGGGVESSNKDTPYDSTKWKWDCGTEHCYECRDGYEDKGGGVCAKYACKEPKPADNGGYIFAAQSPQNASQQKVWEYKENGTADSLNPCEYTCKSDYEWKDGVCVKKEDVKYNLKFSSGSCHNYPSNTVLPAGTQLTMVVNAEDCDGKFGGWYDQSGCIGTRYTNQSYMPNKDLTLYACVKKINPIDDPIIGGCNCDTIDGTKFCGVTCFVAGTKVTMADGTEKNIEDVKIGEKIMGKNGVNTVLGYYRPSLGSRHLWSINGSEYFVSDEHPFMTTEGWKSFNPEMTKLEVDLGTTELKVGDVLVTNNGLEVVETVDFVAADYDTQLYNFVLDGDHTYYANGYLVHNKTQVSETIDDSSVTCGPGKKRATAGNKGCCPDNGNFYYGAGACIKMNEIQSCGGGCVLKDDRNCIREYGDSYKEISTYDKKKCEQNDDYYVCMLNGPGNSAIKCHNQAAGAYPCLEWWGGAFSRD